MPFPPPHSGVQYTAFLAQLCAKREVERYLEIGVEKGLNLSAVNVPHVIGIDPAFDLEVDVTRGKISTSLYRMSSDRFFRTEASKTGRIDLAFLDGMHVFEYLLRDFYNTEAICTRDAVIFMHDCMPFGEEMVPRQSLGGAWTGDVWKIVPILQKYRPDVKVTLIDCAPTGLVAVSRLDPENDVLRDRYQEIVDEFLELPNDGEGASSIYRTNRLVKASEILDHFDHTLFFRV